MQNKPRFFLLFSLLVAAALLVRWEQPAGALGAAGVPEAPEQEVLSEALPDGSILLTRLPGFAAQLAPAGDCAVPPPVLLSPADGAQLDTLIPDYTWQQVEAGVSSYRFQLSRQPDFATLDESVVFRTSSPSPGADMTGFARSNLLPDTTYYWRLASICEASDQAGAFSAPFSFRTGPAGGPILPAPTLLLPADGAAVLSTLVTFSLSPVDGAIEYQYRFYDSPDDEWDDWSRLLIRPGATATSSFTAGETLYWRAAAVNSYAVGEPSAMRSFETVTPLQLYLPAVIG